MKIVQKIESDYLKAYKAHDEIKVSTLRMLKTAVKNQEIAQKAPLSDTDATSVIKKEIKQRQESVLAYKNAGRTESAEKEEQEVIILSDYLPVQLSEKEIEEIAQKTIEDIGAKDISQMGQVIGKIMAEHKSNVDGAVVSKVVKHLLEA